MRQCPSVSHLTNRLRTLALTSPPETALFYARLWHAILPPTPEDHECLHVLSLCYLQSGQVYTALGYVRDTADSIAEHADHNLKLGTRSSQGCFACAMILGKCCDQLGTFSEGKDAVERALKRSTPTSLPTLAPVSSSATAYLTMASLSRKGKEPEQAVEAYARALAEDPWLWEAFVGLCDIGAPPSVESIFPNPPISRTASQSSRPPLSPNLNPMPRSSASEIPGMPLRRQLSPLSNGSQGLFTPEVHNAVLRVGMMGNPSSWETPSNAGDTTFPTINTAALPTTSRRPLPNMISAFIPSLPASFRSNTNTPASTPLNPETNHVKGPPAMKRPRGGHTRRPIETPQHGIPHSGRDLKSIEPNGEEMAPIRRSSRLKTTTKPSAKIREPREARGTRSRSATSISSTSAATVEVTSPSSSDPSSSTATDDWLRDVLRRCARAYRYLSIYACQEVVDEIKAFPMDTINFSWCIDLAARAYFEMANYKECRRLFDVLLTIEPYAMQSMELYSTALWHLGDAPALSSISQWLIAIDKELPQPWIAAGNCFSIQKNHDEAMRCFRRATQVDPSCAYAWTLCGYEAIEMEEYDRAMAFYRTAIRTDSRHYNAWYGMGLVYLKMGKPKYAEHHFRRAAEINPTSPVLLCCIGMVLEQMDDQMQALSFYDQACKYAPESSMPAYRRIRVLVALQRIDEAVDLLEPLSRTAPDEANIHFLLAKCYLKQGRRSEATLSFTEARELQPRLENAIKIAMGGGGEDDEEDEAGGTSGDDDESV